MLLLNSSASASFFAFVRGRLPSSLAGGVTVIASMLVTASLHFGGQDQQYGLQGIGQM